MTQNDIVVFADASVHEKKKTTSIGLVSLDSDVSYFMSFVPQFNMLGRKAITAEATTICMTLENARERGRQRCKSYQIKKCDGYCNTKNYSLIGDRDYL